MDVGTHIAVKVGEFLPLTFATRNLAVGFVTMYCEGSPEHDYHYTLNDDMRFLVKRMRRSADMSAVQWIEDADGCLDDDIHRRALHDALAAAGINCSVIRLLRDAQGPMDARHVGRFAIELDTGEKLEPSRLREALSQTGYVAYAIDLKQAACLVAWISEESAEGPSNSPEPPPLKSRSTRSPALVIDQGSVDELERAGVMVRVKGQFSTYGLDSNHIIHESNSDDAAELLENVKKSVLENFEFEVWERRL